VAATISHPHHGERFSHRRVRPRRVSARRVTMRPRVRLLEREEPVTGSAGGGVVCPRSAADPRDGSEGARPSGRGSGAIVMRSFFGEGTWCGKASETPVGPADTSVLLLSDC
jgi:hypothetical protein